MIDRRGPYVRTPGSRVSDGHERHGCATHGDRAPGRDVGTVVAGCARSDDRRAVESAVGGFFAAVRDHDGSRACAGMIPEAAGALETGGSSCSTEVLGLGLHGGPITAVQIWGDDAQVKAGDDTVFLTRWGTGWRLTAAGCERRPDRPYDCAVEA